MLLWSKLTEYSCKCNDFRCLFVVYGLSWVCVFCQSKQLEQPSVPFKTRELLKVAFITFSGVVC